MIISHGAFGIEFEWLATEGEPTLSYRFRAGEHALGSAGLERSLTASRADVTQLLRHEGNRRHDSWRDRPPERLLRELQAALVVDFDWAVDPGPHWDAHSRFVALPVDAPAFSGWSGFLVEADEVARLVWARHERRAPVLEQQLAPGDFEAALKAFHAVLEQPLSSRQSTPPTSGERFVGLPGERKSAS